MIIRRKPIGREGIRKPRTLGLSLLREGIARVQALSVQRQSTADEPIDWGEGVPDDIYTDYDTSNQLDSGVVDQGDYGTSFADALQQAEQPVPRPANEARRTARRRVQRQQAEPPPQVITPPPPPAPSRPLQRQSLSDGDTMPTDLQAMWELHKRLGHIREKPVVTRRADGSPIPRRRAAIVEMPSKKNAEPELPHSASPIGEPIQREPDAPAESTAESFANPMLPEPDQPAQLSAGSDAPAQFDAEATLTDFRIDAAADVRRSPMPSASMPHVPVTPPANTSQSSVPPGAAREFAPSSQFDGGDPDDPDDEPDTASENVIQRSASDPVNAVRRAAIEAAIGRFALPTLPNVPESDAPETPLSESSLEDTPNSSDAEDSVVETTDTYLPQTPQPPTPRGTSVQRTTIPDSIPSPSLPSSFVAQDDVPPPESPGRTESIRRSTIDAAVRHVEQPAEPIIWDTPESSTPTADTADPFAPTSPRPASIQRQAESHPSMPPNQPGSISTPKPPTTDVPPPLSEFAAPDVPQNRAESVRRAAIDAAVARAEQSAVSDVPESEPFVSDAPQDPAIDRPERTPASIQRQAAPSSPASAAPKSQIPPARPTTSLPTQSDLPPAHVESVRRAAIEAAVARAEQPAVSDVPESEPFVSDAPQDPAIDRPERTPSSPASAAPKNQIPPARPTTSLPTQSDLLPAHVESVRRAAIEAAVARAEQPVTPDVVDDLDTPTIAVSGASTRPNLLPSRPASIQRQFVPSGPAQRTADRALSSETAPDHIDSVRRVSTDVPVSHTEQFAAPDEFETFASDEPPTSAVSMPPPTTVQRDVVQRPMPPDRSDSVRRAAIEAAIARAEQPSAPDMPDDSTRAFISDTSEIADDGEVDNSDQQETPAASPSRPTSVQRHAAPSIPEQPSPDATSALPDYSGSVRRAAIEAAIARAEQPVAPDISEISDDISAPDTSTTPSTSRSRPAPTQRRSTLPSPEQSSQTSAPPPVARPTTVQRAADASPTETPDVISRRAAPGRRESIETAVTGAEQSAAPDEFEPLASDEPELPDAPSSLPAVQRQAIQLPTLPDRSEAVRHAAIEAAIARAEQPTQAEPDESAPPSTPPRGRKSTASTPPASTEMQPAPARRQTVQRHPGHSDTSTAAPRLSEDESIMRAASVRRAAIDAAIARAEQPAALPSFDFPEADADYVDVGDVYETSTGDSPDLPSTSRTAGRPRTRGADAVRRSARSDAPLLHWPSAPRTPDRSDRTARSADTSVQRAPESDAPPDSTQATAEEVGMLRMLGLPPETPIARSVPSTPPLVHSAPPEAVRRTLITGEIVQRDTSSNSTTLAASQTAASLPTNDVQQAEPYTNADVEQVAQAVYQSLRNRLRIERERSHGRVQ
ncbi:MAG: DNA polymerase III subunit gamma/tau domain-containing protein [Aggregatilineales bacterium]